MQEELTYNIIEDYLNGKLSAEQLTAFEKDLQQNSDLKKKMEAHKLANELVIEYRLQNIQSLIQEEKQKTSNDNLWIKILLGLTGGLIIASLFLIEKDKTNSEKAKNNLTHKSSEISNTILPDIIQKKEMTTKAIKENINKPSTEYKRIDNSFVLPIKDSILSINKVVETQTTNSSTKAINEQDNKLNIEPINHCKQVEITSEISIIQGCEGEENGSILISGFSGGTAPYTYDILRNNHEYSNTNLSPGKYSIQIKDSKGCIKNIEGVEVTEKACAKDYSFNPFIGETWEIPKHKKSGTLILYDEGGNVYFSEEITAEAKQEWSGQSKNGEIKTGYFLFVINYKDGTSKQGSVTIVR